MLKGMVLTVLALLVLLAPAMAQDDDLIVPGQRVGWMKVGMDFSVIQKAFGASPCDKMQANDVTIYTYKAQKFQFYVKNNKVMYIITGHPKYRLASGVTVGTPKSGVIKALGQPSEEGNVMVYDSGIGFKIANDAVSEIAVLQTEDSASGNVSVAGMKDLTLVYFYTDG